MSTAILTEFWNKSNASHGVRTFLLVLASYAQSDAQHAKAYPGIETISQAGHCSPRTVHRWKAKAHKEGHLEYERSASPVGTNLYTLFRPWRPSPQVLPLFLPRCAGDNLSPNYLYPPLKKKTKEKSPPVLRYRPLPSEIPIPSPAVQQRQRTCPHPPEFRRSIGEGQSVCTECFSLLQPP